MKKTTPRRSQAMSSTPPPSPSPPKRRYTRTFFWGMTLLGLAVVVGLVGIAALATRIPGSTPERRRASA
jgi:type II secretory pathway pseudopilin PulG